MGTVSGYVKRTRTNLSWVGPDWTGLEWSGQKLLLDRLVMCNFVNCIGGQTSPQWFLDVPRMDRRTQ